MVDPSGARPNILINDNVTKNKIILPRDLNNRLGSYKCNVQATLDHYGHSMNCGRYPVSFNCCEKQILQRY